MQPWQNKKLDEISDSFCQLASEKLAGDGRERDRIGEFDPKRWQTAADIGLLGLAMDEPWGQGKNYCETIAAFEGIARGCEDSGFLFALFNQVFGVQKTLEHFASERLKQKYLTGLIAGKYIGCYAFTEEACGSDAFGMETTAVKVDGGYQISGKKSYLTNSPFSNIAIVFAKTAKGRNPFALTAFVVDLEADGCRKERTFEKSGLRTVHMGEFSMDQVFVPDENIIGSKGTGLRILTDSTALERAVMTVIAVGAMKRGLDAAVERCQQRQSYGKPIGSYQQISSKIANMVMRYRLCRQLQYDTAGQLDSGISATKLAQQAAVNKLFITENFTQFEMDALQIFGVRGYLLDHFVQQDLRDSLAGSIWAGTSETLRNTIAKLEGLAVD